MKRSERSIAGAASGRGEGGKGCPDARSDPPNADYACPDRTCKPRMGDDGCMAHLVNAGSHDALDFVWVSAWDGCPFAQNDGGES